MTNIKTAAKGAAGGGEKSPIEGAGVATVKGRVVVDGDVPERASLVPNIEKSDQKDYCLKGDTKDPKWIVGKDKGIKGVVVWLRAPAGKYFKVSDDVFKPSRVTIDQPYCAFEPHVVATNPTVFDPSSKKQKKTGQAFEVLNSASVGHNTAWTGNKLINPDGNRNLPASPKDGKPTVLPLELKPCQPDDVGGEELVNVSCDIHKWMTAKVAVFDHPYYAVTDGEGKFEIKGVPSGSELTLAYWHESSNENLKKGAKTEKITVKEGDNGPIELKIKP